MSLSSLSLSYLLLISSFFILVAASTGGCSCEILSMGSDRPYRNSLLAADVKQPVQLQQASTNTKSYPAHKANLSHMHGVPQQMAASWRCEASEVTCCRHAHQIHKFTWCKFSPQAEHPHAAFCGQCWTHAIKPHLGPRDGLGDVANQIWVLERKVAVGQNVEKVPLSWWVRRAHLCFRVAGQHNVLIAAITNILSSRSCCLYPFKNDLLQDEF